MCICAAVLFSGYAAPRKEEPATLMVYAGAGLKKPMEKIKEQFEKEHSVQITMVYAGSGQLLAQLAKSGKGDVFIVGSKPTYDAAVEKGLAGTGIPVSHHTPVIITEKDNPKHISGLKDLSQEGLRLALGDEKANAIGKTSVKMFQKAQITDYEKNIVVKTATVNELYQAIKSGSADACIVTKDSAFGKNDLALIEIEPEFLIDQIITAGALTISKNPDRAATFVQFLTEDFAIKAFESFGFKPVAKPHE